MPTRWWNPPKLLLTLLLASALPLAAADRWAPGVAAGAVNQRVVSGNACGPAALLAAFRCGDESWQEIDRKLPGGSDKGKLVYIIRAYGLRPSTSLKDRKRWTGKGINSEDLLAVAGEISSAYGQPKPDSDQLFRRKRESPEKLIRRTQDRLRDSLARGFPPLLSVKRYVLRKGRWELLQGHFVTVVRVPEKIGRGDRSFAFTFLDPWGGRKREGTISIPDQPVLSIDGESSTCLMVDAPGLNVGRSAVRKGETTRLVPTVAIGRW